MLNDYEIKRVENKNISIITSVLKLIACSLAVYCVILLVPHFLGEVYETRNNENESLNIRVIANSNTNADQQFKYEVVENLTPIFSTIHENDTVLVNKDEVYQQLTSYIEKNYPQHDLKVNMGEHLTPPKLTSNAFYPQNYYDSLVVTIGSGRGDNFWCSIFSNVCERPKDEENVDEKTDEEDEEVTFIIWEWVKGFFG